MVLKRLERGWPGHFCGVHDCGFRRNTLVSNGKSHIIVSTVGKMGRDNKIQMIGCGRYYETMSFIGIQEESYIDADVTKQINLAENNQAICAASAERLPKNVDNLANEMHESNVDWVEKNFDAAYAQANNS